MRRTCRGGRTSASAAGWLRRDLAERDDASQGLRYLRGVRAVCEAACCARPCGMRGSRCSRRVTCTKVAQCSCASPQNRSPTPGERRRPNTSQSLLAHPTTTDAQVIDLGIRRWRCRESNPGPPLLHEGFSVRSPLCLYSDPPVTRTSRCDDPSRCLVSLPTPRPSGQVSPLDDAGNRVGNAPGPTAH